MRLIRERIPGAQKSVFVLTVESNLGMAALHHQEWVSDVEQQQLCVLHEDKDKPGIRTDDKLKEYMQKVMCDVLQDERLYFHSNMVTCDPKKTRDMMIKEYVEQLNNYAKITDPPKNPGGKPKIVYTGKLGGKNDDLCIASQLALIAKQLFNSSSGRVKYNSWLQVNK
jgi:hypothetical protein